MLVLAPADPRYDLCAGQPGLTEKFCKGSEHKQAQSSHHQHEVARMGSARCCNIIYQGVPQAWHDTNTAKCSQFLTAQLGKQDMAVTGLFIRCCTCCGPEPPDVRRKDAHARTLIHTALMLAT